jgi:hypothetical protein
MTGPVLHKYFDFGDSALANLTLASGERVLLSIVPSGRFAVRRVHVGGFVPGRRVFRAFPLEAEHMAQVLTRERDRLPRLPIALRQHRDESDGHDADAANDRPIRRDGRERPLSLFTRLALSAADADDLARRYERIRNTPE